MERRLIKGATVPMTLSPRQPEPLVPASQAGKLEAKAKVMTSGIYRGIPTVPLIDCVIMNKSRKRNS